MKIIVGYCLLLITNILLLVFPPPQEYHNIINIFFGAEFISIFALALIPIYMELEQTCKQTTRNNEPTPIKTPIKRTINHQKNHQKTCSIKRINISERIKALKEELS